MGALLELSLITGIISKTALPGTNTTKCSWALIVEIVHSVMGLNCCVIFSHFSNSSLIFTYTVPLLTYYTVYLCPSGVLEMGGELNSPALLEFQGHINRFQVRQVLYFKSCASGCLYALFRVILSYFTFNLSFLFQCFLSPLIHICHRVSNGVICLSLSSVCVCPCLAVWRGMRGRGCWSRQR